MNQTFTKKLCSESSRHNHKFFPGHNMPILNAEAGLCDLLVAEIPS